MIKSFLVATACPLCGSSAGSDTEVVVPAQFSTGDITPATFSARRLPDKVHYQMVRCKNDGLIRSNPILSPEYLKHLYADSTLTYANETSALQKTYVRVLESVLSQLSKQDAILEIGAGNGFLMEALIKRGFTQVWGVEPGKKSVNQGKSVVRDRIKTDMFSQKLFPTKQFKLICCFQTLDHIADPNEFLTQVYDLLTPGGFFVSFHHDVAHWPVKVLGKHHPIFDIEHTFLYDKNTTQALCYRNGFVVNNIYSPANTLSLRHLLHLLPLPTLIKQSLSEGLVSAVLAKLEVNLKLGNLVVVAQKPQGVVETSSAVKWVKPQRQLRKSILDISFKNNLSHLGSCLCSVDIIEAIYQLKKKDDQFVLSNGHAGVAWYAVLEKHGFLTRRKADRLFIHPDRNPKYNIPVSTGSLGQGLPIAVGLALADPHKQIYCLISDGEMAEGSIWEAMRIIHENQISNIHVIVSANGWAGYRSIAAEDLRRQIEGFGFHVIETDGHDLTALKKTLIDQRQATNLTVIMAHTKVDQFDFLEGQDAHYYVMTTDNYASAIKELSL